MPLCLSELIKGTLCNSCLNFYTLLVSRGTCIPLYYGLAPKVLIHLSLIKIVCSFFETDSCGSQLFCMTSNQLQYCKKRYKKLQSRYHTIGSQFSLVWEAGNKMWVPQELRICGVQLLCKLLCLLARGTTRQQPWGSNSQLMFEGKKYLQLCAGTAKSFKEADKQYPQVHFFF